MNSRNAAAGAHATTTVERSRGERRSLAGRGESRSRLHGPAGALVLPWPPPARGSEVSEIHFLVHVHHKLPPGDNFGMGCTKDLRYGRAVVRWVNWATLPPRPIGANPSPADPDATLRGIRSIACQVTSHTCCPSSDTKEDTEPRVDEALFPEWQANT